MVSDAVVREVVGPDLFVDVASSHLIFLGLLVFVGLLLLKYRIESLVKHLKSFGLVLVLISLVL